MNQINFKDVCTIISVIFKIAERAGTRTHGRGFGLVVYVYWRNHHYSSLCCEIHLDRLGLHKHTSETI